MTFEQACAAYPNRFTMDHVPDWAKKPRPGGSFYAPHYASDKEWFSNTLFPPHNPYHVSDCHSQLQTWPLGKWLDVPYAKKAVIHKQDLVNVINGLGVICAEMEKEGSHLVVYLWDDGSGRIGKRRVGMVVQEIASFTDANDAANVLKALGVEIEE